MAAAPLHRPDLVAEQGNAPPFGRRRFPGDDPPVRVGTTGTGAGLLLLAWSASDLAREVAAGVRVLGRLGVRAAAWDLADRVQCEVLVLDPATAPAFFQAAPGVARSWWRGIVWLERGEGHTRPPAPRDFDGWQRTWLAVPEVASFAGGSCERGALHVDASVAVEVVNGHAVLEARGASAAPVPFDTEMAARLVDCACGGGPALELTW